MSTLQALALALACAAALPGAARAQSQAGDRSPRALAALQRRAVWGERALRLQAALAEAGTGERADELAAATALLRPARGAGVSWYPPLEHLIGALRALAGPPEKSGTGDPRREREQAELQAQVDALDLVVVPGGFAPRLQAPGGGGDEQGGGAGRGEPITVHVQAVAPIAGPGTLELELRLFWVGTGEQAGRVERARTEPVSAQALEAGFPAYLRPPASGPARWRLVPELARAGLAARSEGVEVPCLDWPPAAADENAGLAPALVRAGLEVLRAHGVRWFSALDAGAAAELLADPAPAPGHALPLEQLFLDPDGAPRLLWLRRPAGDAPVRVALLLLCNDHEPDDLPLAGPVGARWAALADRRGALLLSAATPGPSAGLTTGVVVERALRAARDAGLPAEAPLVAVGRGGAAARLTFDPSPALAAAVLCTEVRGDPAAVLPGTTRLLVGPLEAAASSNAEPASPDGRGGHGGRGGLARADATGVLLLDDLELPGLVEPWLERLGW